MENPVTLAWMGDALYSVKARKHILDRGVRKADLLQKQNARLCSAAGQAFVLDQLMEKDLLNEDEREIVRRGRNAHVKSVAKNSDLKTYLKATALEALFGYLYLYDHKERMEELLKVCMEIGEQL
ncbi:Mini-ribonuclease 3 [Allobaculum sp. JKK-2023]|uniref:Mini-ribonuclease 3 n=1 Tax=Allobaculum sp. JKK-2023 TaxID=3108943 RepID=UPI002B056CE9|nr:ribonuclease III domain-containing protein [Allobaculum sp. JKK-2023]